MARRSRGSAPGNRGWHRPVATRQVKVEGACRSGLHKTDPGCLASSGPSAILLPDGRFPLLILWEAAPRGPQADLGPACVHLRRVRGALQRHHREGRGGRAAQVPAPARDLRRAQPLRHRPGPREEGAGRLGLQPLQAHRPARQGRRGRDPEGQHPAARADRLREDAAGADAGEEARRAVRHGRRHDADRGRLRRRGRRQRHQGALPQRRQRSRQGQPRHRLHRRDRQDRAQGRRSVGHARRLGRGRAAGAAQDPRGQAGVDHARRRAQPARSRS